MLTEQKRGTKSTNDMKKLMPLQRKLQRAIENKKFMEPNLTLASLAHDLGSNRTYLSDLIHQQFNMSFSDYINHLRITEAKRLLETRPEELTDDDGFLFIKNVYIYLGYNCATSFYRNFKRIVGMSASEYMESVKDNKK